MLMRRVILLALGFLSFLPAATFTESLPVSEVTPRLELGDLQYLGGFRVPSNAVNGDSFAGGGLAVAFNPAQNSLFISSYHGNVAEVSIPTPAINSDPAALPYSTFLQPFSDPTEGHVNEATLGYGGISSLLVVGNRLHGTAQIYYDANNEQRVSHYSRSLQLTQPSFSGWSQVWDGTRQGYVSGFLAAVPSEWQARLGGPTAVGQCCIPIVSRTSFGPSAFAFEPALIGRPVVAAEPLLYYDQAHQTLGQYLNVSTPNPTYNQSTEIHGFVIVEGTRTALFIGRSGTGIPCYGKGTSDHSKHGTFDPVDGAELCYDLDEFGKGTHAWPYRYQIWAYDLNDLAAVKAGAKQPWDVVPYGVWPLNLPTPVNEVRLGGVGYDPQRQILYVSQRLADFGPNDQSYRPIIHAFRVTANGVADAPATGIVQRVLLSVDRTAPQAPATPITFTATPSGGSATLLYRWSIFDGQSWRVAADWTTADRFTWTPATPNPSYGIGVSVRSAGSATTTAEASASIAFPIELRPTEVGGSNAVSKVTLIANKTAPQNAGTTVTWTATASGTTAPLVYKWWVFDGSTWTAASAWTASATFEWTPTVASAGYRVGVFAKGAANPADLAEASTEQAFAVVPSVMSPIAPPSSTTNPIASSVVKEVVLSADRVSPQPPATTIIWTAQPVGGVTPHQYQWWVFDGARWTLLTGWRSANTFAWLPNVANPQYKIAVWVRSAGAVTERGEATTSQPFVIKSAP